MKQNTLLRIVELVIKANEKGANLDIALSKEGIKVVCVDLGFKSLTSVLSDNYVLYFNCEFEILNELFEEASKTLIEYLEGYING